MRHLTPRPSAFTLVELMMTIVIIAVLAALVVPQLEDTDGVRLVAAARLLGSDLELAQVMTIASPAKPVVVVFEPSNGKYWLAYAADPADPIKRPGTEADYVVTFGEGQASGADGVTLHVTGLIGNTVGFNAQGGVDMTFANSAPAFRLIRLPDNRWIQLSISPVTGTITETTGG
jgi:prepilin-type N-terminal cleavage/methylation domain-containing protein